MVRSRSERRRREILTKTRRGGVSLAQLFPVGIWPADMSPDHASRYDP